MKALLKIYGFCITMSAIILLVSCKKNETPAQADVLALLQGENWKLTALTVAPAYSGITDAYNAWYDDCNKDDLYRFNSGNVFILDEGATKCNPADPQTYTGTWDYTAATKIIHFQPSNPGDNYNLTVSSINESTLIGTESFIESGITYTGTWTFAKQ